MHARMTCPALSSPIGSPQGKTRRVLTFNDKSWIVQSDGPAPMAQLSPKLLRGCKDRGAGNAGQPQQQQQQQQVLPSKPCPEAVENLVVRQTTQNSGWHSGAATERQHLSRSSLHPGAAPWRELRRVQEQVAAELQAQAERISKVESSLDIGALQEAVDTAVSERVNGTLGELVSGIYALRSDLQKASAVQHSSPPNQATDTKRGREVMSTLQEDTGQELLFHLEEAMEREKQSRIKFEDTVMSRLGRCRMCASQPQVMQELRTQIQTVEEDLRAATCHLNLEKQVATLASTMRRLLEDCPLGLSPACSFSGTVDMPGSITSAVPTACTISETSRAETVTDPCCNFGGRMDGLKEGRKSGGGRASLRGSPLEKLSRQHFGRAAAAPGAFDR